jgi:hypothetical protein
MERVVRSYSDAPSGVPATSYRAPVNTIGWARALVNRGDGSNLLLAGLCWFTKYLEYRTLAAAMILDNARAA